MSQMPAPPLPNAPVPAFDPGRLPPPPPPPPGAAAPPAPVAPALTLVPAMIAPVAAAPAPTPAAPPAPAPAPLIPAPAPPAPARPIHLVLPTDAVSALDMGVPLNHVAATPDAAPSVSSEPLALQVERPDPELAPAPAPAPDTAADHAPVTVDASRQWWSPANALVLAFAGLTWQFISFYAREQLPGVKASGAELRGFDRLVETLPLAATGPGRLVGVLLAAAALAVILYGTRRGLREPVLQGIVGGVAALSLALIVALPALAG